MSSAGYSLTEREQEVLQWVVQGKSNGEIAIILGIAVRTAKKHMERIFAKLGMHSRAELIVAAYDGAIGDLSGVHGAAPYVRRRIGQQAEPKENAHPEASSEGERP